MCPRASYILYIFLCLLNCHNRTGEYWLKHVQDIASGKNTLLTLPKSLIERLIKYFTVQDVAKLSSLSLISNEVKYMKQLKRVITAAHLSCLLHLQIFNANFVWQALYKKYKPSTRLKCDSLHTRTCNWKQLFQLAQMQGVTSEQKVHFSLPFLYYRFRFYRVSLQRCMLHLKPNLINASIIRNKTSYAQ